MLLVNKMKYKWPYLYITTGSSTIDPEENCSPTLKATLTKTPTLSGEQFSSRAIVWIPLKPKFTNSC